MSMGNLAWVVLLECLRREDWDTAWALVNLVDVTMPDVHHAGRRHGKAAALDALASQAEANGLAVERCSAKPVHKGATAETEAWMQRRLVDPLCDGEPTDMRPLFKFVDCLPVLTFAPKSAGPSFNALAAETNELMSRLVLGPTVAECSCGAAYIAATWDGLELVGRIDDRDEGGELLEQRNCVCGSTMTRELVLKP